MDLTGIEALAAARNGSAAAAVDPIATLEESRVNLIERIRAGIPELEYVPGTAGAFVRGKRHHVSGELKSGKSLSIGIIACVDIVTAGGVAVVLDRENGSEEYARRLATVLDARKTPDALRDQLAVRFRYYAWPTVRLEWGTDPRYAQAFAGADLVVFDSARRMLTATGLAEDSSDDFAKFAEALVDPLMRAGIATVVLDNVGHTAKDRARGSSAKGDLADVVLVLSIPKDSEFNLDKWGRVELRCVASRFGELHGTWELELGGGLYGHWQTQEHPYQRQQLLEACVAALQASSPLGRDALLKAARERGAKGHSDVLRGWIREFHGEGLITQTTLGYTANRVDPTDGSTLGQPCLFAPSPDPDPSKEGVRGQGDPERWVRVGSGGEAPAPEDDPIVTELVRRQGGES